MPDIEIPQPAPPEVICGFTLKRPLAKGRCCITYEATVDSCNPPFTKDNKSDVPVALKLYMGDHEFAHAYDREVEISKRIPPSPYIVKFYSNFEYKKWLGISMELLTGTLRETCNSLKEKPSEWLMHTIATNSLMGLKSLHDGKFTHGDVGLDNIMWNANTGTFCIIDFGISVFRSERFKHRLFSYECSAPEVHFWTRVLRDGFGFHQLLSLAMARPSYPADIWALGITVSRCLLQLKGRLFPDIEPPNTQEEVDSLITKTLDGLKNDYTEKFLNYMKIFLTGCLQIDKSVRKTAAELLAIPLDLDLLSLHIPEQVILPTPILRLENLVDNPARFHNYYIAKLRKFFVHNCGQVLKSIYDKKTGYMYLQFKRSVDAESGFTELQNKTYDHRTLIIRFDYPERFKLLLENKEHVHYSSED